MDYIIKELTLDIIDHCSGLLETLSALTKAPPLEESTKVIFEKMRRQDSHIFVALTNKNEIIGSTSILIEQKFIRGGALVGHIEDVATRKGFEGKGVASALLKKALSYGKERGCYKIILDCNKELVPFYERFGFKDDVHHMRLDM